MMISMLLSVDKNNGIGYKNGMPWPISDSYQHYLNSTLKDNVVIMGSKSWQRFGTIPKTQSYVITTQDISNFPGVFDCYDYTAHTMRDILDAIDFRHPGKSKIIVGGATLFEQCHNMCDIIYYCKVQGSYKCDRTLDTSNYFHGYRKEYERVLYGNRHNPTVNAERWSRKKV